MRIRLLTITHKMPTWVSAGYHEYAKRLPPSCQLELVEIPADKRTQTGKLASIKKNEGEKILSHIKPSHYVIALEITGKAWSTEALAQQLENWQRLGTTIDLLIGGPEGLCDNCLKRAQEKWSLSPLTFPHMIVRLLIAEQLYRANSILNNHPYHR